MFTWPASVWRLLLQPQKRPIGVASAATPNDDEAVRTLLNLDARQDLTPYGIFLRFWVEQRLRRHHRGSRYAAVTDQAILNLVRFLHGRFSTARYGLVQELKAGMFATSTLQQIGRSLDTAVRLWMMLNVTDDIIEQAGTLPLVWRDSESLEQLVARLFPKPVDMVQAVSSTSPVTMNHDFTAMSIRKYTGLDIRWTNSLEDHLRMRFQDDMRILRIFPHKAWLVNQIQLTERAMLAALPQPQISIMPGLSVDLLRETLWTLDLLFPANNSKTLNFLIEQGVNMYNCDEQGLNELIEFPPVEIRRYTYWRERLLDINNELQSPPRNLLYALVDNRNPLQWWTFFLAFLVTFLTVFIGVYQVVLAEMALQSPSPIVHGNLTGVGG